MNRFHVPALALAAAATASGCASDGAGVNGTGSSQASVAEEGASCFWPSQVNGFSDAGRDHVYVHTGVRDVYLFEIFGTCPDLDFAQTLALKTRSPGTICRGLDVDLIVPGPIGPQRCPVRMIRKLSDAEVQAQRHRNGRGAGT